MSEQHTAYKCAIQTHAFITYTLDIQYFKAFFFFLNIERPWNRFEIYMRYGMTPNAMQQILPQPIFSELESRTFRILISLILSRLSRGCVPLAIGENIFGRINSIWSLQRPIFQKLKLFNFLPKIQDILLPEY